MIRTVIIDDEQHSRELTAALLGKYCPDVQLVGFGDSVQSGLLAIREHQPALVLLDVELSDGTGFDLLNQLGEAVRFEVIFITAFDHYAARAFRFCAIDYLLKPLAFDDLKNAVDRAGQRLQQQGAAAGANQLLETLLQQISKKGDLEKIALPTADGLLFVRPNEIARCEADGNYTWVCLTNRQKVLVSRTLKEYEDLLEPQGFFRIHHAHLINLQYIRKYTKGRGGTVEMEDGVVLDVASRRRDEFLAKVGV